MISRKSKSNCPAVRAVNDYMRHSGFSPSADQVNGFCSLVAGWTSPPTPEHFQDYLAGAL